MACSLLSHASSATLVATSSRASANESLKRRLPQFWTTDVHLYHDDNIGKSVMFVEFNKESV